MDYHLHDQEQQQVEAIQQWWKENGSAVIMGVSAGIIALAGWRFWQNYAQTQSEQASFLYEQIMKAAGDNQAQQVRETAQNLLQEHPSSTYAALASLMLAQTALKETQLDAANTHLQWVIDNAKLPELVALARLRKAQVLFSQDQADAALGLLKQGDAGAMRASYDELEGDILLSQSKTAEAKTAYAKALTQLPPNSPSAGALQMKHDDLGADEPVVAALDAAEVLPPLPKEAEVKVIAPPGSTLPAPEITTTVIAPPPGATESAPPTTEAPAPANTPAQP